jgi:predicted site-specific integrase-resolvase
MKDEIKMYKREWLSFEEFGMVFGVKGAAVRQWYRKGVVKAKKFSEKFYRIHISELERLRQEALTHV